MYSVHASVEMYATFYFPDKLSLNKLSQQRKKVPGAKCKNEWLGRNNNS